MINIKRAYNVVEMYDKFSPKKRLKKDCLCQKCCDWRKARMGRSSHPGKKLKVAFTNVKLPGKA